MIRITLSNQYQYIMPTFMNQPVYFYDTDSMLIIHIIHIIHNYFHNIDIVNGFYK